jgi:hypothetical protein
MTDEMTTIAVAAMACPKDGTPMAAMGRRARGGAYRCLECKGVFLDIGAMRGARGAQRPWWAPLVTSLFVSVGMTMVVRRLRRRPVTPPEAGQETASDGEQERTEAA